MLLALAVVSLPRPASACSCASAVRGPNLASCQTARRVFAGTVDHYDWPAPFRAMSRTDLHLAVDTVWRGAVPPRLIVTTDTVGGGGSCTYHPTPGDRFLVCDDQDGGAEPGIGWCFRPAFGAHADELTAALGPGVAPSATTSFHRPWWTDPQRLAEAAPGLLLLLAPFVAAFMAAGVGALVCVMRPASARRTSLRRLLRLVAAVAIAVVVARLVLRAAVPDDHDRAEWALFGPPALAAMIGVVLGFRRVRLGEGAGRGLAVAFAGVAAALVAGYARLHLPVQPRDVVACSEARAREHLRAYPEYTGDRASFAAARAEWAAGAPAACTDWGLSRLRADALSPALRFADGRGGEYWVHREYEELDHGWEWP